MVLCAVVCVVACPVSWKLVCDVLSVMSGYGAGWAVLCSASQCLTAGCVAIPMHPCPPWPEHLPLFFSAAFGKQGLLGSRSEEQ